MTRVFSVPLRETDAAVAPCGCVDVIRPLRVLVVTAGYPTPEDPSSCPFIKSQVESLALVGIEPTVLHLQGHATWKYLAGVWQVARLADPRCFDLVHAHYGYGGVVARVQ